MRRRENALVNITCTHVPTGTSVLVVSGIFGVLDFEPELYQQKTMCGGYELAF